MIGGSTTGPIRTYTIKLYDDHSNVRRLECGDIANFKEIPPTKEVVNFIFDEKLELVSHNKRSGKTSMFIFKSVVTDREFLMYADDFVNLIKRRDSTNGVFEGKWSFKKQGPALGLIAV